MSISIVVGFFCTGNIEKFEKFCAAEEIGCAEVTREYARYDERI